MSIAQRKDKRWVVKYKTDDGWKQRTFRKDQEEEARRFDAEMSYDERDNTRITVAEAVLAYLKNTQHVKQTVYVFKRMLLVIAAHLANKFVDSLTRRDLESVRDFCRGRGMQNATINMYTGKLQAAFRWCAEQDLIEINPWQKYRSLPEQSKHLDGSLEDFRLIYAELPEWMQWACRTSLALCLRTGQSELFRLKWSVFDWRQGLAKVYMPKVNHTKTVFIPSAYLKEARIRYEEDMANGRELVCRNRNENALTKGLFAYTWRRACQRAGVKMPPYAMRHIAASEMLAGGADLAAVAAQLGHKNINTTSTYYTHVIRDSQQRAAKAIPLVSVGAEFKRKSNNINT